MPGHQLIAWNNYNNTRSPISNVYWFYTSGHYFSRIKTNFKPENYAMKKAISIFLFCLVLKSAAAQEAKGKIERACLDYIEGFYEGDTAKLIRCLKPSLYKFGYWKNNTTGHYDPDGQMTYRQAIDYAKRVMEKKNFANADAPKKVEILDVLNSIAAAKVTAWWGIDYILLSKQNEQWTIDQVLWEGPLVK